MWADPWGAEYMRSSSASRQREESLSVRHQSAAKATRLGAAWLLIVAMAVLVTAEHRAFAQRPLGIDVSAWTDISISEWTAIYNSGRTFGWARASYGWGYTDSRFVTHMTRAKNAGLIMGAYHYNYAGYSSGNTPLNEANTFLNAASSYITSGYLRPVLDIEYAPGPYMGGLTLTQWCNQWMDRVEQVTGVEPLVYTGAYFAATYLDSSIASRDLWIAAWPSNPNPQTDNPSYLWQWPTWCFWQYAGDVSIPGVTTQKVDLNVFNGTAAQLQAFVIGPKSTIAKSVSSINTSARAGTNAANGSFQVWNSAGQGTLNYHITTNQTWLAVNPATGSSTGEHDTITVNYTSASLGIGIHQATITVTDGGATNSPQTIGVTLTVLPVPGDMDANGVINYTDVAAFRACMTGAEISQNDPGCQSADIDQDGDVDMSDFGRLTRCLSGFAAPDPYCAD